MKRWEWIEQKIHEHGWTRGAEIGVAHGKTYKYLMSRCDQLVLIGVDPYVPQPFHPGPEKWVPGEFGKKYEHELYYQEMKLLERQYPKRAIFFRGFSLDVAPLIPDEFLDFVFIDADHATDAVVADIRAWEPKVKKGGCVIGHDVNWPTVEAALQIQYDGYYETGPDNLWFRFKGK